MKEILGKWKKEIVIGLVLGLGLLVLLLWPGKTVKQEPDKNGGVQPYQTVDVGLGIERLDNQIGGVSWENDKIVMPETISELDNQSGKIDSQTTEVVAAWLEVEGLKETRKGTNSTMLRNEQNGDSMYVNQANKQIHYSRGGDGQELGGRKLTDGDMVKAETSFKGLMSRIGQTTGKELRIINKRYQKIMGQRAIFTTTDDASLILFEASYLEKEWPLLTSYGYPMITARYANNGLLVEAKLENPLIVIKPGKEVKIKSWDEIKQTKLTDFLVFRVDGSEDWQQSSQSDFIGKVTIKTTETAYVYSPAKNKYLPFLMIEGNGQLQTGPVKILMGLPLGKE